jgi:hypothetical protein
VESSAEFKLALDCCRHGFSPAGARPLDPPTVDWALFLRLVHFHRIEGLAWNGLSAVRSVPEEARQVLSAAAARIAANSLQATSECRALLQRFEAAGIRLLFLKGLTLGTLAYGNPALKAAIDIDLLVAPADLRQAAGVLRECGYALVAPAESRDDRSLLRWHRGWKESVWSKAKPRIQIDLHTRTADNPRLIPTFGVGSPSQQVAVGSGVRLPTLALDELFAYLAVHGASSAWFRLKWIADFAGLIAPCSAQELERLYRRSQELGAGRAAGQALLLSDALFGTLGKHPALREELRADRATRRLFAAALRLLRAGPVEPTASRLGTITIHWTQFLMLPNPAFKLAEAAGQLRRLIVRPPA